METLLFGDGLSAGRRAWPQYMARNHMGRGSPGQGGADKAVRVWTTQVDSSVRRWIEDKEPESRDFAYDVVHLLTEYKRSELRRLNASSDYGVLSDILGTSLGRPRFR